MTAGEIFNAIAINFFTGCAQELASRFDDKAAAAGIDAERWRQRSKGLDARIVEALSAAARRLEHAPKNLDELRTALGDQVFVSETAAALIAGTLEPDRFSIDLARREPALQEGEALKELARAMVDAFSAVVAADAELAALVGLRRSEDLKRDVQNVSEHVEEVGRGVFDLQVHSARREDVADVKRAIQEMHATFAEQLGRGGARLLPLENPADERLAESTKRRFDNGLDELKNGSAAAAAREFRSLLSDLTGDAPNETNLLFRATANLGIALHYLGDTASAAEQFNKAYAMKPDSVRAKANKILSSLTSRDYETAERLLDDALSASPTDLDLINFKAQLLADRGDVSAAISFLEDHPAVEENYFIALAIYYTQAGEYELGAQAARKALEMNPQSDGAMAVLADAIAMPIVFRKTELKLPAFALSIREAEELCDAVDLTNRALAILRKSEHRAAMAQLLINLSAYSAAAGDYARAASAAEEAAGMLPDNPAPLANLYMAQMHLERFEDAAKTAQALAALEDPTVATMREMDALMEQREFPRVIALYRERIVANPALLDQPHAACVFALALFKSFDTEAAIEELQKAAHRFPNHPLVLLEEAHLREELRQFEVAEQSFKAAAEHAAGEYAFHAKQQLGLFYYRRENWFEAERHLLGGAADPLASPLLIRYLICLYQLGRYRECLSLAQAVIKRGGFQETVWELATNCHLHFKDLQAAERLLVDLVKYSDELRHWLKLFEVTFRLHDVERARKVLQRAHAKYPDSFQVTVNLSGVEFTAGRPRRAFELALRAVALQPDHPDAHRAVIRCGLLATDDGEFSLEDKQQIQASIARLAGQEGSGVKPFEVTENLSSLVELMRSVRERAGKAEELFSTKGLPMAFLTRVLGKSPFTIWSGLTAHNRLFVPMAGGSQEEQNSEKNLATARGALVVDISALFTLEMLKLLELLTKLFDKIYVSTAVFESIKAEVDELTTLRAPESVLAYADGGLVMSDIPVEVREANKSFLSDLLNFLKSGAVELAGIDGTVWEDNRARNTIENLGESGYSIAVAIGAGITLYSDDRAIRSLAKTEHQVAGFSSQAFLRAAVEKGHLEPTAYEDALLSLFRHNYDFVSEGAETVIRALQQDEYAITPLTRRLVSRIAEPSINQLASATILGNVLADIWRNVRSDARADWVDLIAQNIAAVSDFAGASSALFQTLAQALLRMPAAFFGLSHAILRSRHLTTEQKCVWNAVRFISGRAAAAACATAYPNEPEFKRAWYEHLVAAARIDDPEIN